MTTDEKLIRNKLELLELELVSVLASFVRHLKLYSPDGDSESPEYLKDERILTVFDGQNRCPNY